jgi:DNA (cytosine-5)-methyltransferase 1
MLIILGMRQRNCAEFFAGIGLMRMGLEQAGWNVAFANDIDPVKKKIYDGHFGENEHFVLGDIHGINVNDIPNVSLATASFPCTDLSLAGKRGGLAGPQSSAFWGFVNILEEMGHRKPKIVLLENVPGFLSSNKGQDFKEALQALNKLGYLTDAFIINASHFVPQSRERLFIAGKQKKTSLSITVNEPPVFYESSLRPSKLAGFIFDNPDIHWDIRDFSILPERNTHLTDILEKIPKNSKLWWSQERVDYLFSQMSERHKSIINQHINGNKYSYGTVFRRVRNNKSMAELRFDGIAGCLRTPKGGSAKQIVLQFGKGILAARLLTPRECGYLMGAGDYKLTGTFDQSLFGFGDAVCVPVVKWIAENYLNPLYEELYYYGKPANYTRLSAAV